MTRLKVMTILGTRPEIIRLSRILPRLDAHFDHAIVHTGQNWDPTLNANLFQDLGLRRPDHHLDVASATLGQTLGKILAESERVIAHVRPDALLVLGDTNSALSALMARRRKVPVYHMEAGNRAFDRNVPEEMNRRILDHIADFNLVYTEQARQNLLAEGLPARRIFLTGSPLAEVLDHYGPQIRASDVLDRLGLLAGQFLLASLHREENVDDPDRLSALMAGLLAVARHFDLPVILSGHPRTRDRLERLGAFPLDPRLYWMEPLGFLDYAHLQGAAFCTISDSGSVAEESAILGFPAITPRESSERPEGLEAGPLLITAPDPAAMLAGVITATRLFAERRATGQGPVLPPAYAIADSSARVVSLIEGTARLAPVWDGLRPAAGPVP